MSALSVLAAVTDTFEVHFFAAGELSLLVHIARLATGGAREMFRAVVGGKIDNGYALIHPPGHLAEPGRFVKSSVANFRARF